MDHLEANIIRLRDQIAAIAAAFACAHAVGLIDLSHRLPQGALLGGGPAGRWIGLALCALVYAIVLTWLYRRRLVAGPLYRCGATRPHEDYGKPYRPGTSQLLEGWHYR